VIAKYLPLLAASLRRKRLRTFFTLASIVVAFLLFGLAESLRYALQSGVDVAGADRLLTMHKVSFTQLLPVLTAERNVELPLLLKDLTRAQRARRVAAALSLVGLADRAKHRPRELSGGQEQRVGIARAIVTDPTLLLCDEPTGDLDRKSGDEVLDLLQALNREYGTTIVMVTHDPHAAERAHRTVHLDKGLLREDAA